jgi:hypothetical protein
MPSTPLTPPHPALARFPRPKILTRRRSRCHERCQTGWRRPPLRRQRGPELRGRAARRSPGRRTGPSPPVGPATAHRPWLGHTGAARSVGTRVLTDPCSSGGSGSAGARQGRPRRLISLRSASPAGPVDLLLLPRPWTTPISAPPPFPRPAGRGASWQPDLVRRRRCMSSTGGSRWRSMEYGGVDRRCHRGARLVTDRTAGRRYCCRRTGGVLFAGDTAYTDAFRRLTAGPDRPRDPADRRLRPLDLQPRHSRAAWRMFQDAEAEHLPPIHHSTFRLSREPPEPVASARRRGRSAIGRVDRGDRPERAAPEGGHFLVKPGPGIGACSFSAKSGAGRRRYRFAGYSTVTDLARLRGWSTLHPRATAT